MNALDVRRGDSTERDLPGAPGEEGPADGAREQLASLLREKGALTDDWLDAYWAVPRDAFAPDRVWPGTAGGTRQGELIDRAREPERWWGVVHSDVPLTTQWDDGAPHSGAVRGRAPTSSNSMPKMVFSMLAALDVERGDRVLEVGTGTGWNAALLAHRVGPANVVTVEVDPAVAEDARRRFVGAAFRTGAGLRSGAEGWPGAGRTPLSVIGDGTRGWAEGAPYDRIIVTCGLSQVPYAWIEQARPGTVIVVPWGPPYGGQGIARLTVRADGTASGRLVMSSAFMRLRGQRDRFPPTRSFPGAAGRPGEGERRTTSLSPDEMGDWHHMFTLGVLVPDLFCRVEWGEGGAYRLWLLETSGTSWATADYAHGRTAYEVVEYGPRRLWAEAEAVMEWWREQDGPGFDRYGLTVTPHGQQVWLDAQDNPVPSQSRTP